VREAEVAELGVEGCVEEHVRGLDVAVDDGRVAALVEIIQRHGHLERDRHAPRPRQRWTALLAVQPLVEVPVWGVLEHQDAFLCTHPCGGERGENRVSAATNDVIQPGRARAVVDSAGLSEQNQKKVALFTSFVAVAEQADDVRVPEREEHVELLAERAVEALAAALHLDGAEAGGGEAGQVHGAEPALPDHPRREPGRDGLDLRPREPSRRTAALAHRRHGFVRDAGAGSGIALVAADARGGATPGQHFPGDTRGQGGKLS
jgi:hypothetical protein